MPLYVQRSDNIKLWSFSSVTCRLKCVVRYRSEAGGKPEVDEFEHTPNTNRTEAFTYRDIPIEGNLESINLFPVSGNVRRGEVFAGLDIQRQRHDLGSALCQGYVSEADNLFYASGAGKHEDSINLRGKLRSITGTNPAAGAQSVEVVPANARWLIRGWRETLVTDATVLNRNMVLLWDDGATILGATFSNTNQPASVTYIWTAWPLPYTVWALNADLQIFPIPPDLMLFQGWRLRTQVINLQAGDDLGAPQLYVEEWIED